MKFVRQPFVMDAEQFFADKPLPFAADGAVHFSCKCGSNEACSLCNKFWVDTFNGPVALNDGDWVIKGKGEFYPCPDKVFAENYERAE